MSLFWVPRDPRAYPVYPHKGKGYSLMNVFDPKVAGGMAMAALPEAEPVWTTRIRDNFLHRTNESMSAYANFILGAVEADTDVDTVLTREELNLLSSEESTASSHGLTHRSSCAGPQQRPVQEPAGDDKEARRNKHEEKKTNKEKTTEKPASAPTCKRPSTVKLLDYIVVSDSLSGLDAGVKRSAPDPDDTSMLTKMMAKKQKILADKKRELDEQAALAISEKKLKMMGETVAPSESKVDLGDNSLSFFAASDKSTRPFSKGLKINISDITPPTSPPPVPFGVSPPQNEAKGKGVESGSLKTVIPPVALGVVIQEGIRVERVETNYESSEATPPQGT
ncbi:hypothetical protein Hanom_Chr12g01162501 [Helianthus anomalus]